MLLMRECKKNICCLSFVLLDFLHLIACKVTLYHIVTSTEIYSACVLLNDLLISNKLSFVPLHYECVFIQCA